MVHLLQTGGVGCFAYVWYELGKWTIRLLLFIRSERTLMLSITNRRKSLDLCVHDSLWPWRPCVLRSPFRFSALRKQGRDMRPPLLVSIGIPIVQ